jgi:hypothetical protein
VWSYEGARGYLFPLLSHGLGAEQLDTHVLVKVLVRHVNAVENIRFPHLREV